MDPHKRKLLVFNQNPKFPKCRAVSRTFEDLKSKTVLSELLQAPNNSISGPIVPGESRNAPIFLSVAPPISGFWLIFTAGNPIPLRFPYAGINRVEYCSAGVIQVNLGNESNCYNQINILIPKTIVINKWKLVFYSNLL